MYCLFSKEEKKQEIKKNKQKKLKKIYEGSVKKEDVFKSIDLFNRYRNDSKLLLKELPQVHKEWSNHLIKIDRIDLLPASYYLVISYNQQDQEIYNKWLLDYLISKLLKKK
jgi:hypothetical protein